MYATQPHSPPVGEEVNCAFLSELKQSHAHRRGHGPATFDFFTSWECACSGKLFIGHPLQPLIGIDVILRAGFSHDDCRQQQAAQDAARQNEPEEPRPVCILQAAGQIHSEDGGDRGDGEEDRGQHVEPVGGPGHLVAAFGLLLGASGDGAVQADLGVALEQLRLYSEDTFAWAAGEAVAMQAVRRVLLEDQGLPPENVKVTGYWRRDEADFDYDAPLSS